LIEVSVTARSRLRSILALTVIGREGLSGREKVWGNMFKGNVQGSVGLPLYHLIKASKIWDLHADNPPGYIPHGDGPVVRAGQNTHYNVFEILNTDYFRKSI